MEEVTKGMTDLPKWLIEELTKSMLCAKHRGQARCDCDDLCPGWFCLNPKCGVFNGTMKEDRKTCRACDEPKEPKTQP
jgi:hypothetical protein